MCYYKKTSKAWLGLHMVCLDVRGWICHRQAPSCLRLLSFLTKLGSPRGCAASDCSQHSSLAGIPMFFPSNVRLVIQLLSSITTVAQGLHVGYMCSLGSKACLPTSRPARWALC